ncbi:MAG: transposase [Chloroflexota bacterium]
MDDRAALLALPKEQLVDIILAQRETIARLEALVVQLTARVAELEAKIDELTKPPTTPDNSNLPPSAGFKPNRAERRARKHGPKRGHQGHSRLRQPPDVVVRCYAVACRGCGHALHAAGQRRVRRSQVIDVVPARAVVVESWAYQARCTECGLVTVAEHPAGLEPTRTFGPELETILGYLHERHHVSFERLVELCEDLFGVQLSEGAVANVLQRLGDRGQMRYQEIKELVRASPVIGSDETGARVDGRNRWHRGSTGPSLRGPFQTNTASYHVIARTRSGSVIDDFLDGAVPEVWQSDAYAPQLRAPAKT